MNPDRSYYDGLNLILSGESLPDIHQLARRAAPQLGLQYLHGETELAEFLGDTPEQTRNRLGTTRLKLQMLAWLEITVLRRDTLLSISPNLLLLGDALPRLLPIGIVLVPYLSLGEALRARHRAWGDRFHDPVQRAILKEALRAEGHLRRKEGVASLAMSGLPQAEREARLVSYWRQLSLQ